jgi:hypothetical protein
VLHRLHVAWVLLSTLAQTGAQGPVRSLQVVGYPVLPPALAFPFGGQLWERQRKRRGRYTVTSKRRTSPARCSIGCVGLAAQAEEIALPRGVAFHFRQFGDLVVADDKRRCSSLAACDGVRSSGPPRHCLDGWRSALLGDTSSSIVPKLARAQSGVCKLASAIRMCFCQRPKSAPRVGIPFGGIGSKLRSSDFCPTQRARSPELWPLFCGPSGHRSRAGYAL